VSYHIPALEPVHKYHTAKNATDQTLQAHDTAQTVPLVLCFALSGECPFRLLTIDNALFSIAVAMSDRVMILNRFSFNNVLLQ
jgi:hypothetical protein